MSHACTVLMYHIVDAARHAGEARQCCTPAAFEAQMRYLADHGWSVVPLSALSASAAPGAGWSLPERAVVITFDDGTACTHDAALPILARHGFASTVFVVSGLIGRGAEWNASAAVPRRMMSAAQLRELPAGGMEVGSHTVNHVRLAGLPDSRVRCEVSDSRRQLEDTIGAPVRHFAYPYGSLDAAAQAAVQEAGYEAACSTAQGRNRPGVQRHALHRTEVLGSDSLRQFAMKLRVGTHDMPPWSVPRAAAKRLLRRAGLLPDGARHAA